MFKNVPSTFRSSKRNLKLSTESGGVDRGREVSRPEDIGLSQSTTAGGANGPGV